MELLLKKMLKVPIVKNMKPDVLTLFMDVAKMVLLPNGTKLEKIAQNLVVPCLNLVAVLMVKLLKSMLLVKIAQKMLPYVNLLNLVAVLMVKLPKQINLEQNVQKEKTKKIVLSVNTAVAQMDVPVKKMKMDLTVLKLSKMTVFTVILDVAQMVLLPELIKKVLIVLLEVVNSVDMVAVVMELLKKMI
jgi:hypothetical protein